MAEEVIPCDTCERSGIIFDENCDGHICPECCGFGYIVNNELTIKN